MDDSKTVSSWRLRTERRGCHPWTVRIMVGLRGRAQATPLAALPRRSLLQRSQACSIRSSGRAPTASSPRTLPSPHLISSRMRLPLPRRSSRYCSKKLLPPLPPQIPSRDQKTKKKEGNWERSIAVTSLPLLGRKWRNLAVASSELWYVN